MLDKIAIMAGIAQHENIVKFIAYCDDADKGKQSIISLSFHKVLYASTRSYVCTYTTTAYFMF